MQNKAFQFDSIVLDNQIKHLLLQRLQKCGALFQDADVEYFKPELRAAVNFAFWYLSIWRDKPTPGMSMLDLRWGDRETTTGSTASNPAPRSLLSKLVMFCLMVGLKYVHERLQLRALREGWAHLDQNSTKYRAAKVLQKLEVLVKISSFVNLLVFLRSAKYPTLEHRVAGYQIVQDPEVHGGAEGGWQPNYAYMNRQVIWERIMKLVLVAAPFVDWSKMFQAISRSVRMGSRMWTNAVYGSAGSSNGAAARTVQLKCVDCGTEPAKIPYQASCGHIYCFYCFVAASNQAAGTSRASRCIDCGSTIEGGHRYKPSR